MMILLFIIGLFPGLYIMSQNSGITFMLGGLFTLFMVVIGVFGFVVIFKHHVFFKLTKDGLVFSGAFWKWDDIRSYRVEMETQQYYSDEMNRSQSVKVYSIILDLEDGSSARVSVDKLSRGPAEIVELFDVYKNYSTLPRA